MESDRTMVMVSLPVESNPIEPHRPGTFVLGYREGNQEEVHTHLNKCKKERNNVILENSWLLPVGISFVPTEEMDPRSRNKNVRLDVQHAAILLPLTRMDNSTGSTWAVPITDKTVWVFPTGTMLIDLEAKIEHARNTLVSNRSGLGVASSNLNLQSLRGDLKHS